MESVEKKHGKQIGGLQTSLISLNEVILKNLFYCYVMQKHCSIRDTNKVAFRISGTDKEGI